MEMARKLVSACTAVALSLFLLPLTASPAAAEEGDLQAATASSGQGEGQGQVQGQAQGDDQGEEQAPSLTTQKKGKKKDIVLGMFTQDSDSGTDNIFASYNGRKMYRIASTYESRPGEPYMDGHYAQSNPSIMYHKGYFWSLANENRWDGKFHPVISYSKDLVHWTHPESGQLISGTNGGVKLDKLPTVNGAPYENFDVVAPEWSKSKNGKIYIVFSAGYYGANHGDPTNDQMQAYTVKVSKLSARSAGNWPQGKYLYPDGLKFKAKKARKLSFSNHDGANYIDGQIFSDKGKDYLVIKRDGLWNELYKTSNINKPNGWKLVNREVTYGYEGASICKLKGKYFLYADEVKGSTAVGVKLVTSKSLTKGSSWGTPTKVKWTSGKKQLNARHGTVITLKAGSDGWKVANKLLKKKMK